jgi:hypothetical protein
MASAKSGAEAVSKVSSLYCHCIFHLINLSQIHAGANLLAADTSKSELLAAQDYKVLQKVFERLDKKRDGKIDKEELLEYLLRVKYEPVKVNQYGVSEVEHMYDFFCH